MTENLQTANYIPTDLEIDDVLVQVPSNISRETIKEVLIKMNGDVTESILYILTDNNIQVKETSPKRLYPKEEIKQWSELFKSLDKYNIEHNIERVKDSTKMN